MEKTLDDLDWWVFSHRCCCCCLFNLLKCLVASSKSLTDLELKDNLECEMFKTMFKERTTVVFPSLKRLSILWSHLDWWVVGSLLACCSTALEVLRFDNCNGMRMLRLSGFFRQRDSSVGIPPSWACTGFQAETIKNMGRKSEEDVQLWGQAFQLGSLKCQACLSCDYSKCHNNMHLRSQSSAVFHASTKRNQEKSYDDEGAEKTIADFSTLSASSRTKNPTAPYIPVTIVDKIEQLETQTPTPQPRPQPSKGHSHIEAGVANLFTDANNSLDILDALYLSSGLLLQIDQWQG
ncbi:hypothetical protein Cgig2_014068 [Carnegiea gigantea]|uniref:Uncharacterized protein n=1 Tax=Carnegiea gigantea TaxID=171969 RepID=A0A9Q1KYU1_9CARY|nr:hypothetical protein Cgig2_014068 [Carnegiea gigantea]